MLMTACNSSMWSPPSAWDWRITCCYHKAQPRWVCQSLAFALSTLCASAHVFGLCSSPSLHTCTHMEMKHFTQQPIITLAHRWVMCCGQDIWSGHGGDRKENKLFLGKSVCSILFWLRISRLLIEMMFNNQGKKCVTYLVDSFPKKIFQSTWFRGLIMSGLTAKNIPTLN